MSMCEPPRLVEPPSAHGGTPLFATAYVSSPYGKPERTAVELTIDAMRAVSSVPKDGRNAAQGFSFRGIDGVLNAVGPALRKAGVLPVPFLALLRREVIEVGVKRTPMDSIYVEVDYLFYGPACDAIAVRVPGSAMDSGDKGVAKAMSVAYRTALIQLFALPTQEQDPDVTSYERAPLLEAQAMAARDATLAASTVEQWRQIYAEARAVPGLGAIEVPDRLGHPVPLATLIKGRGEQLASATAPSAPSSRPDGQPPVPDTSAPPPDMTHDLDPSTRLASNGQLQQLNILLSEAGLSSRDRRLQAVSALVRRELTSSGELSMVEARDAIKTVRTAVEAGAPDAWLAELLEHAPASAVPA